MQTRCAIYRRVSTSAQDRAKAEGQETSLRTQQTACLAFAAEQGWQVVLDEQDIGSGAQLETRAGLSRIRSAIRARQVDVLLAHALDRLARSQAHQAILADEAERHGARLEFVTESFRGQRGGAIPPLGEGLRGGG